MSKARVVLVTGASRGVGKGTALALASTGTELYISGRSTKEGETTPLPGNLLHTAELVTARGAHCHPVVCDHADDAQIEQLIRGIEEKHGHIDILVNNVFQVPDDIAEWQPFWERPLDVHWSAMIDVGLRAHYVAAHYAAGAMVKAGTGMIVNISSPGARNYLHSVIYGLGKAATDKMAQDMAKELQEHNVAAFSLWPGIVKTERLQPLIDAGELPENYQALEPGMESAEFTGRIIDKIYCDGSAMRFTGKSWWNQWLAETLNVKDIDGKLPAPYAPMLGEPAAPGEAMIK